MWQFGHEAIVADHFFEKMSQILHEIFQNMAIKYHLQQAALSLHKKQRSSGFIIEENGVKTKCVLFSYFCEVNS